MTPIKELVQEMHSVNKSLEEQTKVEVKNDCQDLRFYPKKRQLKKEFEQLFGVNELKESLKKTKRKKPRGNKEKLESL
jgi:hypothetical protein